MELVGCGCVLALIGFAAAVPLGLWVAVIVHGQRKKLHAVDLDLLSEGDRALWTSYDAQLQKNVALDAESLRRVRSWPKK